MVNFKTQLLFWVNNNFKNALKKVILFWAFTLFCMFLLTLKVFGVFHEVPWVAYTTMPMAILIYVMTLKGDIEWFYKTNINKIK